MNSLNGNKLSYVRSESNPSDLVIRGAYSRNLVANYLAWTRMGTFTTFLMASPYCISP